MNDSEYFQRASAAALRFLSHRPRSAAEVRARLRRQFPSRIVEQVVESLVEQSLLDDSAFADVWTQSRDSHRPRSARAIRRELAARGIDSDVADSAVRHLDDDDSSYRAGLKLARRLDQADFPAFRRKLWGYLKRRGFSDSVTRKTIFRLWKDHRQNDTPPSSQHEDC